MSRVYARRRPSWQFVLVAAVAFSFGSAVAAVAAPVTAPIFSLVDGTDATRKTAVDAAGNVSVAVSNSWLTVNQGSGSSSAWKVDGSGVTQPISGSVSVGSLPTVRTIRLVSTTTHQTAGGPLIDIISDLDIVPFGQIRLTIEASHTDPTIVTIGVVQATEVKVDLFDLAPGEHVSRVYDVPGTILNVWSSTPYNTSGTDVLVTTVYARP